MGSIHGFGREFENFFPSEWIQLYEWHASCTEEMSSCFIFSPFLTNLPRIPFLGSCIRIEFRNFLGNIVLWIRFKKQRLLVFGKGVSECHIVVSRCWAKITSCQKNKWYFSDLIQFFILTCSPVRLLIPHSIWSLVQLFEEIAHLVTHIGLGFSACCKIQSLSFKLSY